ncbi:maleylacetoacetate isomerase [Polymorphobacter fuscus]|uniref:Maleylacetoacetate isomerase n=1 Tax=Sandarakinorhabdus fusca TaxID=1439888 RepID=A0A7C9KIF6_9SPHN|nr:maleylacetoacetate isomerase [Polymorphobacter fuscus]KAB7646603.1 maleylacetoacetate isomerase [Polymorphobacter fuscus]MQT17600.1 maleylacetoacetate isomerase [Polymorphobacter fuscus]
MTLYSYWRSSAAWRVRLALAWKGLPATTIPIDLRAGEQSAPDYLARNPQGLLPLLVDGDTALGQSLAIIEYLDEVHPAPPLLPADALGRARVRAAALIVAADIHPVNNLRIQTYLKALGHDSRAVDGWARHWIADGFDALDAFAVAHGGRFLHGDALSIADLCLVPQLYNARRVATDLRRWPRLLAIEAAVNSLDFAAPAHPDNQPDASPA